MSEDIEEENDNNNNTEDEYFDEQELLNCRCGAYQISMDGKIIKIADCIC